MKPKEYEAAAHVTADIVDEVAAAAHGVHRRVLHRVRSVCEPALPSSAPILTAVERGTAGTYAAVRATGGGIGIAAAALARAAAPADAPSVLDSPKGAAVVAGLTGALGDRMAQDPRTVALAPQMTFRTAAGPLEPDRAAGLAAGRAAPARAAVLVHGLAGHEGQWPAELEQALAAQGVPCLRVRYTSGRPIHANGADLAQLLARLVANMADPSSEADQAEADPSSAADPGDGTRSGRAPTGSAAGHPDHSAVPADAHAPASSSAGPMLVLVGHSMGGLVIRSALAQAADQDWVGRVPLVITLGTPHRGAPMEKVAAAGLRAAALVPESAPIADLGNKRARGIKDLRFGALLPDHWQGLDPDTTLHDTTSDTPLPAHVHQLAILGVLGEQATSRRSRLFGDGMVREASAAGRGDPAERVQVLRLPRTGHMALLRHPEAIEAIAQAAGAAVRAD